MNGPGKILLIEPPFYRLFHEQYSLDRYPLALGYLAAAARRDTGWDVRALNADFVPDSRSITISHLTGEGYARYRRLLADPDAPVWRETAAKIAEYSPDVVGISAKGQNYASALRLARLAKSLDSGIRVVMGGAHVSMVRARVMEDCPEVDFCITGEGEAALVDLLRVLERGGSPEGVPGLIYRSNGRVVDNGPRGYIGELDSLPFPHEYAPEVLESYRLYPRRAFGNIFATRGCPYDCFFCGSREIWSRKVRFRSPGNVVREINSLREKLGIGFFTFDDDTFGVNRPYLESLCRALREHCRGIRFNCEIHPLLVDDTTVGLLEQAGCSVIRLGVESGSNRTLERMRKRVTIERAFEACRAIKRRNIVLQCFFMVGLPWETEETLKETIEAIRRAPCDTVAYSIFTPYPGTEAFQYCREKGLIGDGYDTSLHNHQSPENCFCENIGHDRFRELVGRVEREVDRRNRRNRYRRIFSTHALWKIRELGPAGAARKARDLLLGR